MNIYYGHFNDLYESNNLTELNDDTIIWVFLALSKILKRIKLLKNFNLH